MAILTSVFNFSVFQYLHNAWAPTNWPQSAALEANVAYLNLSSPESDEIVCKLPRVRQLSVAMHCAGGVRQQPRPCQLHSGLRRSTFLERHGAGDLIHEAPTEIKRRCVRICMPGLNLTTPCPKLPDALQGETTFHAHKTREVRHVGASSYLVPPKAGR